MSVNPATILGGPALVQYRGATFYSKGAITLESSKETFQIEADRFGIVDERVQEENIRVSFEPAGEWENLTILWPYAATLLGSLITPQSQAVTTVDTVNDELDITGHGLATGDAILLHAATGGTLPTSSPQVVNNTVYYAKEVNSGSISVHPTAADAAAGTNDINFSAAGTGTLYVDRDHPLVIHTFAGVKLTLHNAAVVEMPSILLGSTKTLIGQVTFEGFLRGGFDWATAASRYTIAAEALTDETFDPADIITQPYTAVWGSSAPWSSFVTKDGFEISFNLGLEPVFTDAQGIVSRRLASLDCTCRATPLGITESQLLTKLLLQDSGAIRGRSLSGDNLNLSATGVYVRLYGAALMNGPQQFSARADRIGQLEWKATRTFTGGAPNALFLVGTAAP